MELTPSGPVPVAEGALDADLLAAVRDEVVAYGVRRATAASIAARAGISRVTLYRRGGTIRSLVLDALSQEFEQTLASALAETAAGMPSASARERLVAMCVRAVEVLAGAPLVAALLRHDPELLLPYLVDRLGRSQHAVAAMLGGLIDAGVADGSIRPVDVGLATTVVMQALTPFVVSAEVIRATADDAAVRAELVRLIDGYLRP